MKIKVLCLFSIILCPVNSLNILAFFINPAHSHMQVFKPLLEELVKKNHNLTVVTTFELNIVGKTYREIKLEIPPILGVIEMNDKNNKKWFQIKTPFLMAGRSLEHCSSAFSNDKIRNLLSSAEKFDLMINEFFSTDCTFIMADYFDIPVVGLSSSPILPWHNERFGNIDNPSYIPTTLMFYGNKMTFRERVENFVIMHFQKFVYNNYILRNDAHMIEKYLGIKLASMKPLIYKRSSLMLVNTHFSLNLPRPLVPNVIEIGGIHLKKSKKLPENIEKFINESKHGVIYFSLGSMIKGHTFPQEKKDAFLKAFARLPQRVLWKWENETMPGKPDNVMIQKWMPQFDILSHPNVKAFISHGGLLGTTEAVHCGVPMMVMPQYGDQYTNAKAVEANGGGVILYLKDATEEKVYNNLKTILDPEFRAKAKALSERFRDRPMSPMDTAIYWVEYVARHKGAPHMKTAAVDMPLYQYLLLDVLAFLGLILLVFSYISYKILSLVLRSVFSKKKVKQN
ncbi:UDP-glycosyltransferase UGT5-like isoform X9 [Harmonia axyridis]|uniref:UDP-glycosyltransferase UGT5-like isoform X9 n=1 Tax=Harmonia axyridis TaxID=115357 RepID=UPI001E278849|nr:UDP-glycosyltransferase UGT5-like isoform X9 [Harmonia axyridis]